MTATTAPPHLWQEAATLIRQLFALFGEPQEIAQSHTLTRAAHKLLASWIRGAEALLRQLLLIEAAALTGPPAPSPATKALKMPARTPAVHVKRLITHDPEHPESWRVSFALIMDRRRPAGMRSAGRPKNQLGRRRSIQEPQRFLSAWPLAERAEALLRVFNNPAPYAKRLARKLFVRLEHAQRLVISAKAHHGIIPEAVIDLTRERAEAALRRFPDSS